MDPSYRETTDEYSPHGLYGYVSTNYEQPRQKTSDIKLTSPKVTQGQLF